MKIQSCETLKYMFYVHIFNRDKGQKVYLTQKRTRVNKNNVQRPEK